MIPLGTPTSRDLTIPGLSASPGTRATLLATGADLELTPDASAGLTIRLPEQLPVSPAHVVRLTGEVRAD